jgi:hypothetical protein
MLGVLVNTSYGIPNYILVLDTYITIVSQNYSCQLSKLSASYLFMGSGFSQNFG